MPTRVMWLPGHPSNGAVSMDRYWRELHLAFAARRDALDISCPLGDPPDGKIGHRGSRLRRAWDRYVAYPASVAFQRRADVAHILEQGFVNLLRALPRSTFKIATVHDLVALHPLYSGLKPHQQARARKVMGNLLAADLILADSSYTADDIVEHFRIDPSRIRVVPLGVDHARFRRVEQPHLPALAHLGDAPKILSIGTTEPRKNLNILPDVMRAVAARVPDVALVRVGPRLPESIAGPVREALRPGRLVELGRVPEAEVVAAYQLADVMFYPSLWEGFGLPILEAMAAGTAVVCSNSSSLPEVGGDLALYFDADAPEQAADQVVRVLTDDALRARLVAAGLERAAGFGWDRHRDALLDVYTNPA